MEQVVCAWSQSMALSSQGVFYTWGDNRYGKLGHDTEDEDDEMPFPYIVQSLSGYKVVGNIDAYNEHSLVLVETKTPIQFK